ncbi:hypothetical protein OG524_36935 (plasmid) [Streptomyces sp. NBC_01520]|uniref:hypothetical protein n=1 Tax=Streptomyces sp. NBC_01520 TaxID=2903892 RepID=UPI002F916D62
MLHAAERTLAGSIESGVLEAYDQQAIGLPSALEGSMPGGVRVEGALYAVTAARWLIQQAVRGKDLPGSTLKRSQTILGLAGGYVATASAMEPSAPSAVQEMSPDEPSPSPLAASRDVLQQHICIACVECGKCSCRTPAGPGVCEMCQQIRLVRMRAEEDIARYKDQMAKGHIYVLTSNRLHRWDCKSLPSVDSCLSQLDFMIRHARKSKNDNEARHLDWPPLPALLTAQELRTKKSRRPSCGMCKPQPL